MGAWEPDTIAFLDRFATDGKVMFDIGAWMGPVTLFAAAGGTTCYSFEPDPVAFKRLEANVWANDASVQERIHLEGLAVTSNGRPIRLYKRYDFGDSGSSMLERVKDSGEYVEIPSVTLMEYVRKKEIQRIDLLKMDVEGGEFELIPSLMPVLEEFKPVFFLALHFPYLVEHAEKEFSPYGPIRRMKRSMNKLTGRPELHHAWVKAEKDAAATIKLLQQFPYIYTSSMDRLDSASLPSQLRGLTDLVFSYRPLT